MQPQEGLAVTGVKSELSGTRDQKLRVAVMGELDALPICNASHTNPETGAAHCCGHHAQLTGVLGAAKRCIRDSSESDQFGSIHRYDADAAV